MEGDFWNNNLLFYILSVISNVISAFSSTVVGYGFISGIHIHKLEYSIFSAKIIQVPYGKDFIAFVVNCLIQFVTSDTYMYNKAFTQCLSPIYIVCLFPWQFLFLPAGLAIPKPWWQ